jgi:CheY-like chemotaxis protein
MKALIADDDLIPRSMVRAALAEWGYEVTAAADGQEALRVLEGPDAPPLAVLDWMMPGLDGVEVCLRVRAHARPEPPFLILLTSRGSKGDVVTGLDSGANDYLTKPFDRDELRARVKVGRRVVELQQTLAARIRELETALAQVRQLQGLLPICSYCKKVRDDRNYWNEVEAYLENHLELRFSHGICPACWETQVKPQLEKRGLECNPGDIGERPHG